MKKITLLFVFMSIVFSANVFASDADLFSYDKGKVEAMVADLNSLEAVVADDANITYQDLVAANNPLISGMEADASRMMNGIAEMPVLPAFWWGCILGPVGIVLVYVIEEDKDQTMSAVWGCVASAAGYTLFYVVYYIIILGAWSSSI
jgi:hypothetical protein